jgi:hypothetical protein
MVDTRRIRIRVSDHAIRDISRNVTWGTVGFQRFLEISDGPRKARRLPHTGSFATKGDETDGRKRRGIEPLNLRPVNRI